MSAQYRHYRHFIALMNRALHDNSSIYLVYCHHCLCTNFQVPLKTPRIDTKVCSLLLDCPVTNVITQIPVSGTSLKSHSSGSKMKAMTWAGNHEINCKLSWRPSPAPCLNSLCSWGWAPQQHWAVDILVSWSPAPSSYPETCHAQHSQILRPMSQLQSGVHASLQPALPSLLTSS